MKYSLSCLLLLFFAFLTKGQEPLNENGYNKIYYPNGSLQSEGNLINGKPEGYWINYYPTGVKKSEGRRKNHVLDSIWIFYNITGDTVSKIHYLNGKKNGYLTKYYLSPESAKGKILSKQLYVNDKIEGNAFVYYEDGNLKTEENYKNNLKDGKEYRFSTDGRLVSIYLYRKGGVVERTRLNRYNDNSKKEGLWQEFYSGYILKKEEYFKNGLLDGYYKEYDEQGKLTLTLLYRNGILQEQIKEEEIESLEQKEYYSDGTIKSSGFFKDDKPVGIHKVYDKTGNVSVALIYNDNSELIEKGIVNSDGKRVGDWINYYPDGEIKAKGKFKNNTKEGPWTYYFKNGGIEQEGSYLRGRYNGVWKWYYPDSKIWKQEEYYNGLEEGLYVEYDTLGNEIVKGEYFEGDREGEWKTIINDYSAVGSYVTGFMDGKWRHYHDNGNLAFEGTYIQGNAQGRHRYYYANGNLKEEQFFNNGLKEKHWKKFDELGNLIITISYKNDKEYRINGVKIDFPGDLDTVIK